jgi:hypothetical protein
MQEGDRKVDEAVATAGKNINGWRVAGLPGDSAHYNGNWLNRAVAAKAGIQEPGRAGKIPHSCAFSMWRWMKILLFGSLR